MLWGEFLEKGDSEQGNSRYPGDLEEREPGSDPSKSRKLGVWVGGAAVRQTPRMESSRSQRILWWWALWGCLAWPLPHIAVGAHSA